MSIINKNYLVAKFVFQSQKTGYLVHELLNEELPFEVEEEVFIKH